MKEGQVYYVVDHRGELKEVSPKIWYWSKFQGYSLIVTHPLGVLSFGYLVIILSSAFLYKEHKDRYTDLEKQVLTVTDILWKGNIVREIRNIQA